MALTTDATPTWEPTEMSRPPQMMTTVWTMARRPVSGRLDDHLEVGRG
ncbi:hypothetical protein [Streptomyces sp. NPDC058664]